MPDRRQSHGPPKPPTQLTHPPDLRRQFQRRSSTPSTNRIADRDPAPSPTPPPSPFPLPSPCPALRPCSCAHGGRPKAVEESGPDARGPPKADIRQEHH